MDKLLQRNPYLKCLESAGILLPTSSSADFAYSHLDESTSRLLAQPHYAQAAAQQLVDMYQQDYSKLKDTQHELSLQHLYSLEIPLASLVQLMKLSQHLLTDNSSQHPALWHATLHRDISMQLDQIRRNSEYGKIAALAQQQGKTSKTTTTTTTCTDRTKEQDMQWETKYMMHQLLQRQSSYQEQDDHDHDKNNDVSGSNRLDWQEALLEVQHDLLTTTTIHWQPHHYEHNPMEFRYKLKTRAQRSEIIRNFYNLIGLRQTLATTKISASTNNDDNRQQEQPYKHYVDQVFRNDCRQRLAPSVESVESFLKTTSRQLKAYINATSSALPFSNVGGALSEFLKPQRHEQLILRRQQQQQQQPSQTNDMNDAVVNNDDVLEELQQDIEDQQQYKQKDVPDEEKMLQLHHHVTLDGALDLVFRLSQDLFGIAIVQDTNKNDNSARFWNADIRLYHIYNHNDDDENKKQDQDDHDDSQQHYLGSFFLDPYQRSGKMHGWTGHIPLYAARRIANGAAAMDSGNESAAGHAVVVLSLQLEPPVWSDDPARITWQNARDLLSQLGYAYQWILSTKSSSLIMSLAKSPANMSVDLVPVIPKASTPRFL